MRTVEEVKEMIKNLEEDIEWVEDPDNKQSDPWEDIPVIEAKINTLKWVLEMR